MAAYQYELVDPVAALDRKLWLQHVAGFILFEDVRRYALERIDEAASDKERAAAQRGIDDALYGLMMVIDGVSGSLSNADYTVSIDFLARLATRDEAPRVLSEVNLREGDGMCVGYHGWLEGDFGDDPIVANRSATT